MVNEKQTKRERNIKSKLMAAIAMLLVSSIMMVSTTYAWFTLSTAPEVTGITTNIASNGNLEIALSPASGMGTDVKDANTNTTTWQLKNLTWGNLVDLSDTQDHSYGLADLTLAPAQLAMSGDAANGFALGDNALATPAYGSDGRISNLLTNAYIAGKPVDSTAYSSKDADYGIRAVGTASGMSAQAAKLRSAASAIGTYANAAVAVASNSLTANGDSLAAMLVMHAEAGSGTDTTNNYAAYVPALVTLTSDLNAALTNIDEALRASLAAAAATIDDETAFNTAIENIEGKTDGKYNKTLSELVDMADGLGFSVPANFNDVLGKRNAVAGRITAAYNAANTLNGEVTAAGDAADVKWADVSGVLGDLMDVGGDIKISGYSVDEIKSKMDDMDFLLGLATNCQIQLGAGSGVYYDLAEITGNIAAKVPEVPISARGINVTLKNVIIKTTASTSLLPVMKAAANELEAGGDSTAAVLDSYYGYVIDLMVRTNAADSYLKLQTVPEQRVYTDSTSEATMGGGTTIIFTTTDEDNVASITDLCRAIRVVFFDPSHEDAVMGLAKVTTVGMTQEVIDTEEKTVTAEDGTTSTVTVDVIEYTITGSLELCVIGAGDATGLYKAGDVLTAGENVADPAKLCDLTQNVPQAISALVYLEGSDVTSSDVLADENVEGALNLQFASSANLQPMQNSDLFNMTEPTT